MLVARDQLDGDLGQRVEVPGPHVEAQQLAGVEQPLEVAIEPEDAGPLLAFVGADPLERARAVMESVGGDVDGGLLPLHPASAHPDPFRLLDRHGAGLLCVRCVLRLSLGALCHLRLDRPKNEAPRLGWGLGIASVFRPRYVAPTRGTIRRRTTTRSSPNEPTATRVSASSIGRVCTRAARRMIGRQLYASRPGAVNPVSIETSGHRASPPASALRALAINLQSSLAGDGSRPRRPHEDPGDHDAEPRLLRPGDQPARGRPPDGRARLRRDPGRAQRQAGRRHHRSRHRGPRRRRRAQPAGDESQRPDVEPRHHGHARRPTSTTAATPWKSTRSAAFPSSTTAGSCCGMVSQADIAKHASARKTAEVVKEVSRPVAGA